MSPHLNHVVRFFPCPVAESKTVKDLQTAALEAVCLTRVDLRVPLVDNPCLDAAVSHPSSSHQTSDITCVSEHLDQSASVSAYPAGPAPMMSLQPSQSLVDWCHRQGFDQN